MVGENPECTRRSHLSIEELVISEIDAVWAKEAERRLDELEQGLAAEIPAEDVLRRARASIS